MSVLNLIVVVSFTERKRAEFLNWNFVLLCSHDFMA